MIKPEDITTSNRPSSIRDGCTEYRAEIIIQDMATVIDAVARKEPLLARDVKRHLRRRILDSVYGELRQPFEELMHTALCAPFVNLENLKALKLKIDSVINQRVE